MRFIGLMLWVMSLSHCGFHLRGLTTLPPSFQQVYIVAPADARQLQAEIDNQLQAYNVAKAQNISKAHYQIVIDNIFFQRQISNISSSTTPRQYQLLYNIKFHVIDSHGENIIPNGVINTNRLVSMNNERLLGSNYEQDFFLHEMQQEAAVQLVSTIGHYFQNHDDKP
jgi:LPS-assembly lipoprotein